MWESARRTLCFLKAGLVNDRRVQRVVDAVAQYIPGDAEKDDGQSDGQEKPPVVEQTARGVEKIFAFHQDRSPG